MTMLAAARWPTTSRLWPDVAIALAIFAFSAFWGARFVASGVVPPQFYQSNFAPAVMEACGKGFVLPNQLADIPSLSDFLSLKQQSFSCANIPSQFKQKSLLNLQASSRYLMGAVAMVWRWTDVTWHALLFLYGALYGVSCAAVYGVFRLGMGKSLAAGFATILVFSSLQLNNLPHLRDYAKAPFIITTVLLLGWLVKYSLTSRKTALLAGLLGMVLGVGFGFRMDLLIFVPATVFTLAVFTPRGLTHDVGARLCAIGAFAATFVATGWPIITAMASGGNTPHAILLGLMSHFDPYIGVAPSSVYELGYLYNDTYVNYFVDSYAQRILDERSPVVLATKAYDYAGMLYYLEIVRNFPADIATRFFAAVLKVMQIGAPERVALVNSVFPMLAVACILCVATVSFRIALFLCFVLLYLCGYPSLQFGIRHYFHLQFVSLFFVGTLAQFIVRYGCPKILNLKITDISINQQSLKSLFPPKSLFGVAGIGLAALSFVVLVFLLRLFQQAHAESLLDSYAKLLPESSEFSATRIDESTIRLRSNETISHYRAGERARTDYWLLELDGTLCRQKSVPITIQYEFTNAFENFSRPVVLEVDKKVRYLFHTYSTDKSFFSGVDIGMDNLDCVAAFGRAVGFENFPLLMNLTFHPDWKSERLYQTIDQGFQKATSKRVGTTVVTFPESLALSNAQVEKLFARINGATGQVINNDPSVTLGNGTITVRGNAPTASSYVLQLPAEKSKGDRYLLAEGELFDGGLMLGLLKNDLWAANGNVMIPGKFRIVMKPEGGEYIATLTHNVPRQKFNHFTLTKLGWTSGGTDPESADFDAKRQGVASPVRPSDSTINNQKRIGAALEQTGLIPVDMKIIDGTVTVSGGVVTIKGDAPSPYSYVLQLPSKKTVGDWHLVVEGELLNGGLTVGLLQNNQWTNQSNVVVPGKFKIVLRPEAGEYTATLAHNVPGQKFNNFRLTKLGWTTEVK